jgi:N-acyl-D-amino-acid deacylase
MAVFVLTAAQERDFRVEKRLLADQVEFTLASFRPKLESIRKGQGVPGGNTMSAYALVTLEAGGHKPDETTAGLVEYLFLRQREDGAWPGVADRPPSEGSAFTGTAFAIRSLKAYGVAAASEDRPKQQERVNQAIARGRDWLLKNTHKHTEDMVFRLRGLHYAVAEPAVIDAARADLLKAQREDGGWSQLPDLSSDAYATGSALVALRESGLPADHAALQKGVKFLRDTQKADGSWLVETRSRPVQVFFDNGDPHGKSQFISFAATGWATLALLMCMT